MKAALNTSKLDISKDINIEISDIEDSLNIAHLRRQISNQNDFDFLTEEEALTFYESDNKYTTHFLAKYKDYVVGCAEIKFGKFTYNRHKVKMWAGVLENFQRKGIASKLIEQAENYAKRKGVIRFEVLIPQRNIIGMSICIRHHYHIEGKVKEAVKINNELLDCYLMAKVID